MSSITDYEEATDNSLGIAVSRQQRQRVKFATNNLEENVELIGR
jgi:hypothetical protein